MFQSFEHILHTNLVQLEGKSGPLPQLIYPLEILGTFSNGNTAQ
jgi:hypothetical protein